MKKNDSGYARSLVEDCRNFHLVGIGGIGTSGVARLLLDRGGKVTGSDLAESPVLEKLRRQGAGIFLGHAPGNVSPETEVVIYSVAVPESNPEMIEARRLGLPVLSYSQALGGLMAGRYGLAVAGAHGKTTTSAMVAYILDHAGFSPGFVIGGEIPGLGGNAAPGSGRWLVTEACEYRRNFLSLVPRASLVTNLEEDHLDYYRDLSDISEAFVSFLDLLPPDGFAVICRECPNLRQLAPGLRGKIFTYGFSPGADFLAGSVEPGLDGTSFRVSFRGRHLSEVNIRLPGKHNVLNSLGAYALAYLLEIPGRKIAAALADFRGVRRRFESRGFCLEAPVFDDYAHHPAEVSATLKGMRQFFPDRRLVVVFQPHQHSRTKIFLEAFAQSLRTADLVILPEIYRARDSAKMCREVSSRLLVERLDGNGCRAIFAPCLEEAAAIARREIRPDDVVLTMGAGPVYRVADELVRPPGKAFSGN